MATPIAHKGVTAGAKVQAMTLIDLLMKPEVVEQAWDYFRTVQTKDHQVRAAHPRPRTPRRSS
jgi:aminobenzoyl-glutamate utilization protein B